MDPGHANYTLPEHGEFLRDLSQEINGVPTHRIANVDETMSTTDKSKQKATKVYVDADADRAVSQSDKKESHITLLPCIWLDGTTSTPTILHKGISPLPEQCIERLGAHFVKRVNWIDAKVRLRAARALGPHFSQSFKHWVRRIFLRSVRLRRKIHNEPRSTWYYLLMDNHPTHVMQRVLEVQPKKKKFLLQNFFFRFCCGTT